MLKNVQALYCVYFKVNKNNLLRKRPAFQEIQYHRVRLPAAKMGEIAFNIALSWIILTAHMNHEYIYYGKFTKILPMWYYGTVIVLYFVFVLVVIDPGQYDLFFYSSSIGIWLACDFYRDRSTPRWYPVSLPISSLYLFFFMYPYPGILPEQCYVLIFLYLWWLNDSD